MARIRQRPVSGVVVPGAGDVARWAEGSLVLGVPEVVLSPPRGGVQLVGVPVWFWVGNRGSVSASAEVPGLGATLVGSPSSVVFVVSPVGGGGSGRVGSTFGCPGLGRAFVVGVDGAWDASECSMVFDQPGVYEVRATVSWSLAWTATNGESGTLPSVGRVSTFRITVQEGQATTD